MGRLERGIVVCSLAAAFVTACRERSPGESPDTARGSSTAPVDLTPLERAAVARYATLALVSYQNALTGAQGLRAAVEEFLARPGEETLARARSAWLDARRTYVPTEIFRFYGGPIDAVEPLVNAWPIDESYIERVPGSAGPGIIDDAAHHPTLSPEAIAALNERAGETSISTGYHAIEFLLWGQDTDAAGPGRRSFRDYVPPAPSARRRGEYLRAATALLVHNLELVADAWRPDRGDSFGARFVAMPPKEALALAWKGLGTLLGPELGGERLTVAYETKDQEDEHSCFSDNTHNDIVGDLLGAENLLAGRIAGDGERHGLVSLVATRDRELAAEIERTGRDALAAARSIPPPFDQAIRGADEAPGRRAVAATIKKVRALADLLARAAGTLDLPVRLWGERI